MLAPWRRETLAAGLITGWDKGIVGVQVAALGTDVELVPAEGLAELVAVVLVLIAGEIMGLAIENNRAD